MGKQSSMESSSFPESQTLSWFGLHGALIFSFCRLTDRLASELVLMAPQVALVDDVSHVAFCKPMD
jgi:hypothetical protein